MKKLIVFLNIFCMNMIVFSQELSGQFHKEVKQNISLEYLIDVPIQPSKGLPLLIFLHGSGERGRTLDVVKNHSPFTYKSLILPFYWRRIAPKIKNGTLVPYMNSSNQ